MLYNWNVYLEKADSDDTPRPLGTIEADTMSEALTLASQKFKVDTHDLIVKQIKQPIEQGGIDP